MNTGRRSGCPASVEPRGQPSGPQVRRPWSPVRAVARPMRPTALDSSAPMSMDSAVARAGRPYGRRAAGEYRGVARGPLAGGRRRGGRQPRALVTRGCYRRSRARPAPLRHRRDRPLPVRPGRGRPRPDAHHARARQAQGDRQGRPPADVAPRRQPRAVRRAARGARPRPDVRRGHRRSRVGHAWLRLRDSPRESAATAWYLAELADRSLEERHERRAAVRAAPPRLRAARRRHGAGPRRPLVRDAPRRRARASGRRWTAASSATGCSRRPRRSAGCRRSAACCAAAAPARPPTGPACRSTRSRCSRRTSGWTSRRSPPCGCPTSVEREVEGAMRDFVRDRARARRPLARLPRRGPFPPARRVPVPAAARPLTAGEAR